jgi:hypothetical protein
VDVCHDRVPSVITDILVQDLFHVMLQLYRLNSVSENAYYKFAKVQISKKMDSLYP